MNEPERFDLADMHEALAYFLPLLGAVLLAWNEAPDANTQVEKFNNVIADLQASNNAPREDSLDPGSRSALEHLLRLFRTALQISEGIAGPPPSNRS